MVKEAEDQVGTMAEARKSSVSLSPDLPGVFRCRVEEVSLHGAVASFLGIQVRGGARQHLHRDLGVLTQISPHLRRAMDLQAIPNHEQRTREPSLKVPEEDHEVRPVNCMVKMSFVDPT
jgi:hypothetical protein